MLTKPSPQSCFRFLFSSGEEAEALQPAWPPFGVYTTCCLDKWTEMCSRSTSDRDHLSVSNHKYHKNRTFRCIYSSCVSLQAQQWRTKCGPWDSKVSNILQVPRACCCCCCCCRHNLYTALPRDDWASIFNMLHSDSTNRIRGRPKPKRTQNSRKVVQTDVQTMSFWIFSGDHT